MAFDPNNPADLTQPRRMNALAQFSMPGAQMQGTAQRAARLTAQGYPGPMPGSPELMAARAAGQHPIFDWRRAQMPQQPNYGGGMGPYGGFIPQNYEPPHTMAYAAAAPQPMGYTNALASMARRPGPLIVRR